MFYDTTKAIELSKNYIAQSAHFQVQGSNTSSTSTSATATATGPGTRAGTGTVTVTVTPPPAKRSRTGLSSGAAAGIGVAVTLLVVALCLLGGFCWFRKRSHRHKANDPRFLEKPELEGRAGLSDPAIQATEANHEPEYSQRRAVSPPRSADNIPPQPSHEVAGACLTRHEVATSSEPPAARPPFSTSQGGVLPTTAPEMYGDSRGAKLSELPSNSASNTVLRKAVPGADLG